MVIQTRPDEREAMSVPAAAAKCGVSSSHLYDLIARGEVPFARRLGRRVIVVRRLLEEWLAEGN